MKRQRLRAPGRRPPERGHAPARPTREPSAPASGPAATFARLQSLVGNRAVGRLAKGGDASVSAEAGPGLRLPPDRRDDPGPPTAPPPIGLILRNIFDPDAQEQYDDERSDVQEFKSENYGPEQYRASTGIGGFRVEYTPSTQSLSIVLLGSVTFTDGISYTGGVATAVQPTAGATAAANSINALPEARRVEAVAQWQWGAAEKEPWRRRFESQIESAWGGKYSFHIEKKYWEDVGASVNVDVAVTEGEKAGVDNVGVNVFKVPANFVGGVGVVESGLGIGGTSLGAKNNEMTLNSVDVEPRTDNILTKTKIKFSSETTTIESGGGEALDGFAIRFKSGTGVGCSLCGKEVPGSNAPITVQVPGQGPNPADTATARFNAIKTELGTRSFDTSRLVMAQIEDGDTATLTVGNGAAQVVAAHEAGHMFGLDDEYATDPGGGISGTGGLAGSEPGHSGPAKEGGLDGAVTENNDSVMSWGNVVQPQHYSTFLEALKDVTDRSDWAFGAATPVVPPGPVDGPLPGQPDDGTRMG